VGSRRNSWRPIEKESGKPSFDNKPDLKDLPKVIKQEIKIHLVEHMDEVLKIALTQDLPEKPPQEKAAAAELSPGGGEGEGPTEPPLTH
jgi:hypothetical protein